MIIFLIIWLFILLAFSYYFNNRDYLAPSFIFVFMFLMSAIDCAIYLSKWETTISFDTIIIMGFGVLSFTLGTLLIKTFYMKSKKKNVLVINKERIIIPAFQLVAFFVFQMVISIMVLRYVVILTRPYVAGGGISTAISTYQHLAKNTTLNLRFPRWLIYSSIISTSSGFFFGYVIAHNFYCKHKNGVFLYANYILSVIGGALTGSRGTSLQVIVVTVFLFFFFYRSEHNQKYIKGKTIAKIVLYGVILLYLFQFAAGLMGRSKGNSFGEYISVYLGAPVKNLDLYITKTVEASTGETETFLMQMNWLSSHFGDGKQNAINTQFNYVNGNNLGNVYSCFKAFYADFGLGGVIVLSMIMGGIIQVLYENVRYNFMSYVNNGNITQIIIYSCLLFSIMFCFFSNRFYESFTVTFAERMFVVFMFSIVYLKRKRLLFRRRLTVWEKNPLLYIKKESNM